MAKRGMVKIRVGDETTAIDLSTYGISLTDGAVTALLTPPPNKEYVSNKSRAEHGTRINTDNAKVDERTINLPFHLLARNTTQFFDFYNAFCNILKQGKFELWCRYAPTMSFRLVYVSCQQFREFGLHHQDGQMFASFNLRVTEPDPTDREVDRAIFPHLMLDRDELDDPLSQLI